MLAANVTCRGYDRNRPELVVTSVKFTFTFATVSIGFDNETVNCIVPAPSSTVTLLMVKMAVSSLAIVPVAAAACVPTT